MSFARLGRLEIPNKNCIFCDEKHYLDNGVLKDDKFVCKKCVTELIMLMLDKI